MIPDVAVIGAGVFGVWTAYYLRKSGKSVVLIDAYGPGNSRSSSGGESRIIRMGYGGDEIYTRWSQRSLVLWQEFFSQTGELLFRPTGVLWMARDADPYSLQTVEKLTKVGVPFEKLSRTELEHRFPQIDFGSVTWGILEFGSGILFARRCLQAVACKLASEGVEILQEFVSPPSARGQVKQLDTKSGRALRAGAFVFACGPWLPKIFPELLHNRIYPTRQDVLFFGPDAGDARFTSPRMPAWIDFGDEMYGLPDVDGRGFKIALDRHGPYFDPDSGERSVSAETVGRVRAYLGRRFPGMKRAPLLEARVCQYENTANGDFLIDRHPDLANVWLVGGGSGHGFKHGPAVGEYVAARIDGAGAVEPRFSLSTKETVQHRSVF